MERKMIAQKMTREYVEEFKRQRELWKQRERQIMEDENRRIIAYANVQKERDDSLKAVKIAREEAMNRLQQKLFEDITKEREAREEMERVRQELYLEEQEQKVRHHERDEMERKLRQRIELQKQHQEQVELKKIREFEQMQEEERIKQEMLAKFAQDDKLELMNAQKRRMKQLEHKHAVEGLLEERRKRMNEDKVKNFKQKFKKKILFLILSNVNCKIVLKLNVLRRINVTLLKRSVLNCLKSMQQDYSAIYQKALFETKKIWMHLVQNLNKSMLKNKLIFLEMIKDGKNNESKIFFLIIFLKNRFFFEYLKFFIDRKGALYF